MRISITVVASDVALSSDFVTLDVPSDMTVDDLKALIEADTDVPPSAQRFLQDGRPITDTSKTLGQLEIKEGDLLGMAVQTARPTAPRPRAQQSGSGNVASSTSGAQSDIDPERLRLHILGDARMMESCRRQDPELAEAASDPERFHNVYTNRQQQLREEQRRKEEQMRLLQADPFNVDAQRKIEEMIQAERIQENFQKAMEENPESFGRVIMLYIDVQVNNVPIKAFVDSGAQTTIMSPDAAKRCGITHLIDKRWGGIARGVGTAKILGRVHSADLQIGQYSLASSFTVMEGKDVDLLLGLDMLKRHQMCIDLRNNCLQVQDDMIPFLPENEIPKMMEEILESEPKVDGPGGSKIGATTGTIEPAEQASSNSQKAATSANTSIGPVSASQTPQRANTGAFGQSQPITAQSIAQITDLGFSREEAIAALRQVEGNVELAIGLLL